MSQGAGAFSFGKCRICKARATGIHYGVATCDGCKGFFRRRILKTEKPKCYFSDQCDVTPLSRNRCKACRFRLCLDNGMSIKAVRKGRIPKIEKEKVTNAAQEGHGIEVNDKYINRTGDHNGLSENSVSDTTSDTVPSVYATPSESSPSAAFHTGYISNQTKPTVQDKQINIPEITNQHFHGNIDLKEELVPLTVSASSVINCNSCSSDTSLRACIQPGGEGTSKQYNAYEHIEIDPFRADQVGDRPDSDSLCSQNQTSGRTEGQSTFDSSTSSRNENQFTFTESTMRTSLLSTESRFPNQPGNAHDSNINTSMPYTAIDFNHSFQTNIDSLVSHDNNPQRQPNIDNYLVQKQTNAPEFSESLTAKRNETLMHENSTYVYQDTSALEKGMSETHDSHLIKPASHSCPVQKTNHHQTSFSEHTQIFRDKCTSPAGSMYLSPTRNISSNVDSSSTSIQRERFSRGLVKVLLQHVLEFTHDTDIERRLREKLQQNKVNKDMITNVLSLVRNVSAKHNTSDGSGETNTMSSSKLDSESLFALPDSKMKTVHTFLKQTSKYSKSKQLEPSPYVQRPNDRTIDEERMSHSMDFEQEKTSIGVGQKKQDIHKFDKDKHDIVRFSSHLKNDMRGGCSLALRQSDNKYYFRETCLPSCEQSFVIESSQRGQLAPNTYTEPREVIYKPMQCNAAMCSDGTRGMKELKKELVQMTLEELSFSSKILHKLKVEHREKLNLRKYGLLQICVLPSDTVEEVKYIYKKIIDGLPATYGRILEFCRKVPGFSHIDSDVRTVLIKRTSYDIWMMTVSEFFSDNEVNIILESGEIYSREAMEKIMNKEITSKLIDFATKFNKLNLSDLEVTILCAVRLTSSDDLELKDKSTVDRVNSLMLDVLVLEVQRNHPDNYARLLISIFQLMPLMAVANKMLSQVVTKYRLEKYQLVDTGI